MPIYLTAMFFVPRTAAFETFAAAVRSIEMSADRLVIDYGVAIGLAGLLLWSIDKWLHGPRFGAVFRVLRMGLLGVIVTAVYQLFCLFTATPMSILILLVPFVFLIAESVYELVETVLDIGQRGSLRRDGVAPD